MKTLCLLKLIVGVFSSLFFCVEAGLDAKTNPQWQTALPLCHACKVVVSSIQNGMEKTNRKHFGGGDTAWEEEKLGDYAHSEIRLIEIQENLCSEVEIGRIQCQRLVENWEDLIEKWWFDKNRGDIYKWLCLNETKSCCPEGHSGPDCKPCPGYPQICNNNGECTGSGTREGNASCVCFTKYTGPECNLCADDYYEYRSESYLHCMECDSACKKCSGPSRKQCIECKNGWTKDENHGCVDAHECESNGGCNLNDFCPNTESSLECT